MKMSGLTNKLSFQHVKLSLKKFAVVVSIGYSLLYSTHSFSPRSHVHQRLEPFVKMPNQDTPHRPTSTCNSISKSGDLPDKFVTEIQIPAEIFRPPDLPKLTRADENLLRAGQRLQRQTRKGKEGMGFACVDVKASESTAWSLLLNYRRYPAFMSTIRDVIVFQQLGDEAKAEFMISRFKFPVKTVLSYDDSKHMLKFDLDPDCKVPAGVFKFASGYWFIEGCPYDEDKIRVWLKGDVKVSRAIPGFIVEYGAERALPRASSWIKPIMEAEHRKISRRL